MHRSTGNRVTNSAKGFLMTAILLAVSASEVPSAAEATNRPGIRLGVCDWTIDRSGEPAALALAGELGLEGVQVSLKSAGADLEMTRQSLRDAYEEAARKTGVAITSFAIGELNDFPLQSDPRAERWLSQGIEIGAAMNVNVILVPFFGKADLRADPEGMKAVIASLKRLAPKAEKAGIILAVESTLDGQDHLKIIEGVGSSAVRIYYDVGNSHDAGYDVFEEIRLLGSRICEFHAKDTKDLYGKGSMDFKAVREAMESIEYQGWLVLEGTCFPLGLEESIRYDANYLRTIFQAR